MICKANSVYYNTIGLINGTVPGYRPECHLALSQKEAEVLLLWLPGKCFDSSVFVYFI